MQIDFPAAPLHDADVDLLVLGASDAWATELSGVDARFAGHLAPLLKQRSFTGKAAALLVLGASDAWATELSGVDARFAGHLAPLLKQRSFTGKAAATVLLPSL